MHTGRCGASLHRRVALAATAFAPLLLALLLLGGGVQTAAGQLVAYGAREGVVHWSYAYAGRDWTALEHYPTCRAAAQSPINVPDQTALTRVPAGEHSMFEYGVVASASTGFVINNGHTVQLTIPASFQPSNASVVVIGSLNASKPLITQNLARSENETITRVSMRPLQLHFHTQSEHLIGGQYYPLEMHIVNAVPQSVVPGCPASGCLAVVGVMFEIAAEGEETDSTTELAKIFDIMATTENVTLPFASASLDLGKLMPRDRTYITYAGSLTTPPCTEGVLWHLLTTPVKMTAEQLFQFKEAVGDSLCGLPPGPAPGTSPAPAHRRRRGLLGVFDNYLGWTAKGAAGTAAPQQPVPGVPAAAAPQQQPAAGAAAGGAAPVPLSRSAAVPLPRSAGPMIYPGGMPGYVLPPPAPVAAAPSVAAAAPAGAQPAAAIAAGGAAPVRSAGIAPSRSGGATAETTTPTTTTTTTAAPAPAETAVVELAPEFVYPPADQEGCRKLSNSGNFRVEQPLNGRTIRMWVDATPCAATIASAVRNSTILALIAGPTGNASWPISIADYDFAVAANLTKPCTVTSGAARLGGAGAWRAAVVSVAALLAALL